MRRTPRVIIVGGGFSGTMVAIQLARRDIASLLIDPAEYPARGVAYSTQSPHHLLNVRAANMSAFPHKPDDFALYIGAKGGRQDSFARRRDYGDYLASLLQDQVENGLVTLVRGRGVRACHTPKGWMVSLASGDKCSAQMLVLAQGNAPPAPLPFIGPIDNEDLIDLFWRPHAQSRLKRAAANDEPVLIVGTGLTMVDALLSLDEAGHRGQVTAVSRHGLLPLAHAAAGASNLAPPQLDDIPQRVSGMVRWLRHRASAESDWRLGIDAIRPITHAIWQRMSRESRERFLRHGRAFWEVHRHRLAPDLHRRLEELRIQGRLTVLAGRLAGSEDRGRHYSVKIARRGGAGPIHVDAGLIINCTGPVSSVRANPDKLIAQMAADELIRADDLDLGIVVDETDRPTGLDDAYAIGPITKGRYWEITAVPDLRVKAAEIAISIAVAMTNEYREAG